ncbi:MAG: four helix bundle protein [Eubacterium sp.]|nr:four helix bundle protein [Eubacterium sp.]
MSNVAEEKSLQLANRIVNLYNYLVNEKKDYVLSRQILRPGTSIGANIAEAQDAQSRKDFVSKMSIALKETSETKYWLKVLLNGTYISKQEFDSLFDDVCEMHKIISSIVLTTKEN